VPQSTFLPSHSLPKNIPPRHIVNKSAKSSTQAPPLIWECTGSPPQWKAHPPVDNYGDVCVICRQPRPGGKAAHFLKPTPTPFLTRQKALAAAILLTSILGVAGGFVWQNWRSGSGGTTGANAASPSLALPAESPERFSSGERRLLRYQSNLDGDRAAAKFATGNYAEAQELFARAVRGDRHDPELQVYLNNAMARANPASPFKIAVVVPVDANASSAEEILRGIADGQTQFNQTGGFNGRLLEVEIANDGNNPKISREVAKKITQDSKVLAVVGHNASAATEAALPIYEAAGTPLIASTSGTASLSSPVLLRTVLNNKLTGVHLADYAKQGLKLDRIAVFYDPNDIYSRDMQEIFVQRFSDLGGRYVQAIDISNPDFQIDKQLKATRGKFDAIALFPSVALTTVGLAIAEANQQLAGQKMKLLGGVTLYTPRTLSSGGNAIEGIVLPVPWFGQTPYAKRASNRWGGQVNWRTALSYDAILAVTKAFSTAPTRETMLKNLKAVQIPADKTAGDPLSFSASGERLGQPKLVQVVRGSGGPTGSGLTFKEITP
jgi:branched-chain amino acid transport system substrate-binding protein